MDKRITEAELSVAPTARYGTYRVSQTSEPPAISRPRATLDYSRPVSA